MSNLTHWRPFAPRLFNDALLRDIFEAPAARAETWRPRVDVTETAEAYLLTAEVPGLDPGEIELTLEGKTLTLKGEKTSEEKQEGDTFHVVERSYGSFKRVFRFPGPVATDSVSAKTENGLLKIEVKKVPEVQPRKIEIQ